MSTGLAYRIHLVDRGVLGVAPDRVLEGPAMRSCAMTSPVVHRHDGPNVGRVVAGDALNGVLSSMLWGHALPHALHSLRVRSQVSLPGSTAHVASGMSMR